MNTILDSYNKLINLGIKQEDIANILPLGQSTRIVFKINVRALEHLFSVRTCTRAYIEFRELMRELRSELSSIDEDWKYLCDNYFKIKCEKSGYCTESQCCGLMPTKDKITEIIKNNL